MPNKRGKGGEGAKMRITAREKYGVIVERLLLFCDRHHVHRSGAGGGRGETIKRLQSASERADDRRRRV